MPIGFVKTWRKCFGYITPDDGGDDVFVHRSCLEGVDFLTVGDDVTFETEWDSRVGKYQCSCCESYASGCQYRMTMAKGVWADTLDDSFAMKYPGRYPVVLKRERLSDYQKCGSV